MKNFWKWLFSRKVVIFWLCFATIYDAIFSYIFLKLYSVKLEDVSKGEFNPVFRYFIETLGLEYTFFVALPLIMTPIILLAYRFWQVALWRCYVYFLFVTRIFLFVYNIFLVNIVLAGGI